MKAGKYVKLVCNMLHNAVYAVRQNKNWNIVGVFTGNDLFWNVLGVFVIIHVNMDTMYFNLIGNLMLMFLM